MLTKKLKLKAKEHKGHGKVRSISVEDYLKAKEVEAEAAKRANERRLEKLEEIAAPCCDCPRPEVDGKKGLDLIVRRATELTAAEDEAILNFASDGMNASPSTEFDLDPAERVELDQAIKRLLGS